MPGAFIERSATPVTRGEQPGADQPVGLLGGLAERYCLTSEPKTSDTDSLSAPDWPKYVEVGGVLRDAVGQFVPDDVHGMVKSRKISPSPSPKTICSPSQKALS